MDEILNTAPCGFLAFADDGRIVQLNETLAALLGWSVEELKERKIDSLFTIANKIFYQTHLFPLIKLNSRADEIFITLRGKTTELPVIINVVRKFENDDFINHCILFPINQRVKYENELINARKRAEVALNQNEQLNEAQVDLAAHKTDLDKKITKLQQVNEDLTDLSYIISHDIQEPIRKISLFVDMVQTKEKAILSQGSIEKLGRIRENCIRMRRLAISLEQFVAASKTLDNSPVDLNDIVSRAKDRLQINVDSAVNIKSDILPLLEGNEEQLSILFYNILDNSVNFRSQERELLVTIRHSIIAENTFKNSKGKYNYVKHIRLEICDNGIGFEDTYNKYVFKMFRKLNTSTKGIGFGLSICQKVVENHSGSINITSVLEKGTCVVVILPLAQ